ncbi:MAG: hypothetical protein GX230_04345 [Lentisphaerae bacterium]|nr:hypothetical protein [Lentisphaerota bacterium]
MFSIQYSENPAAAGRVSPGPTLSDTTLLDNDAYSDSDNDNDNDSDNYEY